MAAVEVLTADEKYDAYVERLKVFTGSKRNAMKAEVKAVDIALQEWGRWMRNADRVLGWYTCSVEQKLRSERDGASQQSAPVEIPEGVMKTDAAVAKLRDIRRKVLKLAYIQMPEQPSDVQRRRLRMSAYRWNSLLREARITVASELGL